MTISVSDTSDSQPDMSPRRVAEDGEVSITLGQVDGSLPSIGVDASGATPPAKSLETVRPAFLRVTIDPETTAADHQRVGVLGIPVEAVVHLDGEDSGSAQRLVEAVAGSGLECCGSCAWSARGRSAPSAGRPRRTW